MLRGSREHTLVHCVITTEQVVTDRYGIVERAGREKKHDDEGQPGDDLLMVLFDGCGEGRHGASLWCRVITVHYIG